MSKTSKITASSYSHSWESQNGTIYDHEIALDNGDSGVIGSKQQDPAFLNVGETLEYEIKPSKGDYPPKITRVTQKPQGGGGGNKGNGYSKEPFEDRVIGFAYSYAKDLYVAGKVENGAKMIATADSLVDAMIATHKRVKS